MPKRNLKPASDPSNPAMPPPQDPYPAHLGAPFQEASTIAPPPPGAYQALPPHHQPQQHLPPPPAASPSSARKRKAPGAATTPTLASSVPNASGEAGGEILSSPPTAKKSRTNTPWSPAEEQRLKTMRDGGSSWSEIAKTFPTRTEGSVKKHWYKDMHYAEFAEDESAALLAAIKDYEASKWKVIGQKVGKPAKACEQYAKEHFSGKN